MMNVRKLPAQDQRVETGPTQFGDDWPGLFIRGDNAFGYAIARQAVLDETEQVECPWIYRKKIESFVRFLRSCMVEPAQAIEAQRAETGTGSVHESAVGNADAPNQEPSK